MTAQRAQELRPQVTKELNHLLKVNNRETGQGVFIHLGKDYWGTLEGSNLFSSKSVVKIAVGTPGKKLSDLYSWLYGQSPLRERQIGAKRLDSKIQIRGIEIGLEKEEVLNAVRNATKNGAEDLACYHSWYALVDGYRVSPKWIIRLLTGLPLSSFHTDEARRVLSQLGIRVHST
jgi:hypothetical protein